MHGQLYTDGLKEREGAFITRVFIPYSAPCPACGKLCKIVDMGGEVGLCKEHGLFEPKERK